MYESSLWPPYETISSRSHQHFHTTTLYWCRRGSNGGRDQSSTPMLVARVMSSTPIACCRREFLDARSNGPCQFQHHSPMLHPCWIAISSRPNQLIHKGKGWDDIHVYVVDVVRGASHVCLMSACDNCRCRRQVGPWSSPSRACVAAAFCLVPLAVHGRANMPLLELTTALAAVLEALAMGTPFSLRRA